ncbi:MAG: hypothetical protein DWQ02_11470 [Bacteroidetes bacterium]|nr:MAG: hypothetical protein DWQ02_11470 [Bacteroidota bacterium]
MLDRKLLFIQSTFGDAHQMVRFFELKKHYREAQLLAFSRMYYESTKEVNFINLGKVRHGHLFSRILVYFNALKIISSQQSDDRPSDIYFFGFDLLPWLALSRRFKRSRLIFEIPDVRDKFFQKTLMTNLMKWFFKSSIKFVSAVVVTSELFHSRFLRVNGIQPKHWFLLENKVHLTDNELKPKLQNREIVIGYFGLLRCERSLLVLKELVDKSENFKVVIHGYFMNISEDLQSAIINHSKISYKGTYKSPQDLSEIYSQIDVSWVAYPFHDPQEEGNFRYAWTNRYYEAGFFGIPMIGNAHSGDAEKIIRNNFGMILDLSDITKAVNDLSKLDKEIIQEWREALSKTPVSEFMSTDEDYKPLIKYLQS